MPRLSLRRRRRTKLDTVKDLAQVYTTLKLSQTGGRAAKRVAKGYAGVKAAKAGGKGVGKLARPLVAVAGIGALVAFLRRRNRQPSGYEAPSGSFPGATPSAYPSGGGTDSTPAEPAPAPTETASAGEPEAPTGPSGTATPQPSGGGLSEDPQTTDLSAGSVPGRESFPLGSSVTAEEGTPAGSAGAPKSATTEAAPETGVQPSQGEG
jgi:hypothetical protein